MTREEREEKVIEAVRHYLPDVQRGSGVVIQIEACEEPEKHDGALFTVTQARDRFACRRGG